MKENKTQLKVYIQGYGGVVLKLNKNNHMDCVVLRKNIIVHESRKD